MSTINLQVQQHEEVLKQKLAALRQEAVNLAQQKKDFVVAKAKASELNDPQINQVSWPFNLSAFAQVWTPCRAFSRGF